MTCFRASVSLEWYKTFLTKQ